MPFVEVTLYGQTSQRTVLALVDSGAMCCLINSRYAEKLGIDLPKNERVEFYGVTGTEQRVGAPMAMITMQVKGLEPVEVLAGFIDSDAVGIILGQDGFFDAHRIKFEKDHNTFEITTVKKK
jgi:predicted aspartyl protease